MRRRKKKGISKAPMAKVLQNKCENLWKEVCWLRDGKRCMVEKLHPKIPLRHTKVMQVDHCFPRSCKQLFFYPPNGTPVCSGCNHPWNRKARLLIQRIVKEREGVRDYKRMEEVYLRLSGYPNFSKVWWLEDTIKQLEALKGYYEMPKV